MLLRGLVRLFHHRLVAEAPSFGDLPAAVSPHGPTVAVVDLDLFRPDEAGSIAEARTRFPDLRIVLLTPHASPQTLAKATSLGIDRVVRRPFAVQELMEAIDGGPSALAPPARQP